MRKIDVLVEGPVTGQNHHPSTWAWIGGIRNGVSGYPNCDLYPVSIGDADVGTTGATAFDSLSATCLKIFGGASVTAGGTYGTTVTMQAKICSGGNTVTHPAETPPCDFWTALDFGDAAAGFKPGLEWTIDADAEHPVTITITPSVGVDSAMGEDEVCVDESIYGPCDLLEAGAEGPTMSLTISGPGLSPTVIVLDPSDPPFEQQFFSSGTVTIDGPIYLNPFPCGDANHDGIVCWSDRQGARDALPGEPGDTGYNVAFDCNGDGEVTQGEIDDAFESCQMLDFNCDGIVDYFDYLDFVDAFSEEEPSADTNGDNVIDYFDYLDFVNGYSGCTE